MEFRPEDKAEIARRPRRTAGEDRRATGEGDTACFVERASKTQYRAGSRDR